MYLSQPSQGPVGGGCVLQPATVLYRHVLRYAARAGWRWIPSFRGLASKAVASWTCGASQYSQRARRCVVDWGNTPWIATSLLFEYTERLDEMKCSSQEALKDAIRQAVKSVNAAASVLLW
jgi:hypothetical protein